MGGSCSTATPIEKPGAAAGGSGGTWRVLCIASAETTATVVAVAAAAEAPTQVRELPPPPPFDISEHVEQLLRPCQVVAVSTIAEALAALADGGEWGALVAALGVDQLTFLFNDGEGDRSDLITAAKEKGCLVVVYSHTACVNPEMANACEDAGADTVVDSAERLHAEVALLRLQQAVEQAAGSPREAGGVSSSFLSSGCAPLAVAPPETYPPLAARLNRYARLAPSPSESAWPAALPSTFFWLRVCLENHGSVRPE